jgi:hypothetical protein
MVFAANCIGGDHAAGRLRLGHSAVTGRQQRPAERTRLRTGLEHIAVDSTDASLATGGIGRCLVAELARRGRRDEG